MLACGVCEVCGRPMRLGVRMSPLKARLFDAISLAGQDGISGDELYRMIFAERATTRACMRLHIFQINDAIECTGYRISGRNGWGYRLQRTAGT